MPISRDPRMDRRRRVLRDTTAQEQTPPTATGQVRRAQTEELSEPGIRRSAGYSQDVRNACGHRLVQLIPIRRRSYLAAIVASCLIPCLLLVAHYMIYVSGRLPWFGHPMALAFDASHPQSIAAWFGSHLWLLCLGATLLTFQLRRHKLDDYNGEYRLWFWLVITCLIASIDSTTHLSELFGIALNRWSQLNLGWSGPAVVQATLAVLIGMLGLRLCSELKTVPASLVFWLAGLVAWAGSAALNQEELKIELTLQFRIWLKCALWLGGLTAIWLAALSYLRSVYSEAQRRFLLRGRMAASSGLPLGRRIRQSLPSLARFRQKRVAGDEEQAGQAAASRPRGLLFFRRTPADVDFEAKNQTQPAAPARRPAISSLQPGRAAATQANDGLDRSDPQPQIESARQLDKRGLSGFLARPKPAESGQPQLVSGGKAKQLNSAEPIKKSRLASWLRPAKDDDQATEFQKVKIQEPTHAKRERAQPQADSRIRNPGQASNSEAAVENKSRRRWLAGWLKAGKPKPPSVKVAKIPKPRGGLLSRIKLPSFGLASLRLKPPADSDGQQQPAAPRPLQNNRPLPGTSAGNDTHEAEEQDTNRTMSKAERKRLRRLQQQDRAA